jgi:transcription initiation factor TFIIE subunit alpha
MVNILDTKKYVNEFLIAKKLNLTINQTRNILYKLLDFGLISSIRKKDKKKGWYTYFWKIENLKSMEFLKDIFSKKIEQIQSNIKSRESKQFYSCERCYIEYTGENSLLNNFTCPECGSLLALKDNTKVIEELKKEMDKLKKQREILDQDIIEEKEKLNKVKQKGLRKEEELKKEEKKQRAIKRKKENEINKRESAPKKQKKILPQKKKVKKKK